MRGRRALIAALGAAAAALALSACGVPVTGSARALSRGDLPPAQAASTTTTAPADDLALTIMLLDPNQQPTPVTRYAPQQQDRLSTALDDLFAGPGSSDLTRGLTTAIPDTTQLLRVSPDPPANAGPPANGPVTVDLSGNFLIITGLTQLLAVEQVVLTVACYLGETTPVAFEVEGSPLSVPTGSGTSVTRPVLATDYLNATPLSCGP